MPNKFENNLDLWDEADLLCAAFLLAYKCSGTDIVGEVSRLPYIMDKHTLFAFLKMYGGSTLTVPTLQEFMKSMQLLMAYDCIYNKDMDKDIACTKCGMQYTQDVADVLKEIDKVVRNFDAQTGRIS